MTLTLVKPATEDVISRLGRYPTTPADCDPASKVGSQYRAYQDAERERQRIADRVADLRARISGHRSIIAAAGDDPLSPSVDWEKVAGAKAAIDAMVPLVNLAEQSAGPVIDLVHAARVASRQNFAFGEQILAELRAKAREIDDPVAFARWLEADGAETVARLHALIGPPRDAADVPTVTVAPPVDEGPVFSPASAFVAEMKRRELEQARHTLAVAEANEEGA